jgi:PD-(D/E)XK nuclease superfamily
MSKARTDNLPSPAQMSEDERKLLQDLNGLVANCPELRELEKLLGNFNLFRVLRFEHGEIRHSNVLAWLLQPDEAHGLNDLFLRRWLMRVFHESDSDAACYLDPAEIDSVDIRNVEVFREWNSIDLVVQLETFSHGRWVVAIENKVRAKQRGGQLSDYRRTVEKAFPKATHRLFLFLTRYGEEPEDKSFAAATYSQVYEVLSGCVEEQGNAIGEEPKVLLNHYLRILKESFMENPEIAALAQKIYQKHRRALDVIFENRTDDHQRLTDAIERIMKSSATGAGVIPMVTSKGNVRFLPKEWKTESNLAGTAWGETGSAYVLCELNVWGRFPRLEVVEGDSPKAWKGELLKISKKENFTNVNKDNGPETEWMRAYSAKSPIRIVHPEIEDVDRTAQEIWNWCEQQMGEAEFKRVLKAVAEHVKKLPTPAARTRRS